MANPDRQKTQAYGIPVDVIEELKRMKAESGRTIVWLIAQSLRFALRPEYRRLWFG